MTEPSLVGRLGESIEAVRAAGLDPESPGGGLALAFLLTADARPSVPTPRRDESLPHEGGDTPSTRLATWSGLEEDRLADLFEFSGERAEVRVPIRRIPSAKSDRQRVLALLKLAADRIAYGADSVDSKIVYALCADYGCADQNLPNNLQTRADLIDRRGKRGSYRYRPTQPGLQRAREIIRELAETDEMVRI